MTKKEQLRPRLIECVDRLRKLIDLDAPAVIIGSEAWNVFATTLAVYGPVAGSSMIQNIREGNLHSRGVCSNNDCVNYVEQPDTGMCPLCQIEYLIPEKI